MHWAFLLFTLPGLKSRNRCQSLRSCQLTSTILWIMPLHSTEMPGHRYSPHPRSRASLHRPPLMARKCLHPKNLASPSAAILILASESEPNPVAGGLYTRLLAECNHNVMSDETCVTFS